MIKNEYLSTKTLAAEILEKVTYKKEILIF